MTDLIFFEGMLRDMPELDRLKLEDVHCSCLKYPITKEYDKLLKRLTNKLFKNRKVVCSKPITDLI